MKRILIASLLCGFAFDVSAQSTNVAVTTDAQAQPAAAEVVGQTVEKQEKVSDAFCLRHTGSRIVERQNRKGKRVCNSAFGRAYTREDLDRTGEVNIADALRRLDPAIH